MTLRLLLATLVLLATALSPVRAQEPHLSDSQIKAAAAIRIRAEKRAGPLALKLAATAKRIYENMLSDREDERLRRDLNRELHAIAGKLLDIKGQSIRELVGILTPEQKRLVRDEMCKPGAPGDLSELIGKVFHVPEK